MTQLKRDFSLQMEDNNMTTVFEQKLMKEREKLNRLVDQALTDGKPIAKTYEIMKQSKKVNRMIVERERNKKE